LLFEYYTKEIKKSGDLFEITGGSMRTKNQVSLTRKILYGIMLLGLFFSVFGARSLPSAHAQDNDPVTPTPEVETQPSGDGGIGFQPPKSKQSLERLIQLINTNNKAAALADKSSVKKVTDTANLKKMDSHLLDLAFADLSGQDVRRARQNSSMKISNNRAVLLDIYINGSLDQAVTQLKGMGMQVMATNDAFGGVIEGYLPVTSLIPAANLSFTKALLPITANGVNTGSVQSEGDTSHNGSAARALGMNGAGVVVGVISDSINQVGTKVAGSQASGDLPASVTILSDDTINPTDEGRAMAEIIYDTAPGITNMYFASGTTSGPADKASAINNLVAHGVDIIADDIIDFGEPFFQDGMVAQAVDNAYNSGVAYFASAGNYARQSYESDYRDLGNSDHSHDFDPGAGADAFQTITTVANGGEVYLQLQWDDPWRAATHDFDFFLINTANISTPLDIGNTDNIASGIPSEYLSWTNNTGSPVTVAVVIDRYSGSSTAFLKYFSLDSTISEYNTSSGTIGPDAASAKGAMTVAAVPWYDSGLNDPESYSSRGTTARRFNAAGVRLASPEVRQKPDIAGADCVSTSVTGFSPFCGTSAAAPSVAGVAALVLSDKPGMTPGVLYMVLKNPANTIDCTAPGYPDNDCGYGFVLADKAVTFERSLSYLFLPLIRR
jgi:hypothetical protein